MELVCGSKRGQVLVRTVWVSHRVFAQGRGRQGRTQGRVHKAQALVWVSRRGLGSPRTQARVPCNMAWARHRTTVWVCTLTLAQVLAGTLAAGRALALCSVARAPHRAVVLDRLVRHDMDQLHSEASILHTENYNPC